MAGGYYKLPEKTAESFFEEHGIRWFRTGDIGEICANGNLRIIGQSLPEEGRLVMLAGLFIVEVGWASGNDAAVIKYCYRSIKVRLLGQ